MIIFNILTSFNNKLYLYMKNQSNLKSAQDIKKKKNNQQTNLEIINNLKQTLSKPTIVQAQRTLKTMEKLIQNISVFLYLDCDFVIKFNELNNPQKSKLNKTLVQELSSQTLQLFIKEGKLEAELKPFSNIQQQIKDGQTIEQQRIAEYNRIKKDMETNFKTLVRQVSKNKNDFEIIKSLKVNSVLNNQVIMINQALGNYKIIMQKKLATAAQEEDMHIKLLEELGLKIKSLQKSKQNCENDLQKLKTERTKHAQQKKEEIDKLKSQIRDVKNNKIKQLERIKKQSKLDKDAAQKQHKIKQEKLNSEIAAQKTKFNKMKQENQKEQNNLKGKKIGGEGTLQQNITLYDKQMEIQHKIKSDLTKELKRLTDQLNNFKKHFHEIEIERKRQQELILQHKKRQQMYELMEKRKHQAANRIKMAYKIYKTKNKKRKKKIVKKK